MFEEKKQSITHLFKTFSVLRLGCSVFIFGKKVGKYGQLNVFENQCHFECEISRELF